MRFNLRAKWLRVTVGIAVPLIALAGALFLYIYRVGPPCATYQLTGIYCMGCGSGRATVALLHGDILAALGYNVLYVIFLPFILYYLLKVYISYVFGKDVLPFFKIGLKGSIAILTVVLLFWILRNIPVFPFTLLAP